MPMASAASAIRSRSGPSPTITSRTPRGDATGRADEQGQVLDLSQPRQRADHDFAGLAAKARNRLGIGLARIERGRDPVRNPVHARRPLLPGIARDRFERLRRHDKAMGGRKREPAIDVAFDLQPRGLVRD